jgi:hypothetical protein
MIKQIDKIMNIEMSRKKFLTLVGSSFLSILFLSKGAFANIWLRNEDSVNTDMNEIRGITNGTISRTDSLITSFINNGRTITINRDGDDLITGWEDSDYEWTLTKSSGIITEWGVSKK